MKPDIEITGASCGYFVPKTGESGIFVSESQKDAYSNLPWYKKLLTPKPRVKISYSNPYLPPEFYRQVKYRQKYIESGIFARAREFSIDGILNVYIEKNKYDESSNKFFYLEDGTKIYIDSKALGNGLIVESVN